MTFEAIDMEELKEMIKNGPEATFEEIAKELGVPTTNVYRVYQSAMRKIRDQMTEAEQEEILELFREQDKASMHDEAISHIVYDESCDDLRGFWRKEHEQTT